MPAYLPGHQVAVVALECQHVAVQIAIHAYNLWSSDYEGRFLVQLKVCLYRFLLNLIKIVYPYFFLLITPLSLHHFPRIITYIVVCNINYRHAIQMIIAYLRYPFTGDIYPPNH